MSLNVGILSIQGDVRENILSTQAALDELGIDGNVTGAKATEDVMNLDGLILPGGESTTIGKMSLVNGSMKAVKEKIEDGMPVLGICAGMIMLSKTADDRIVGRTGPAALGHLGHQVGKKLFWKAA